MTREDALRRDGSDASRGPVLARTARPRCADPVTLAVVADPHLAVDREGTWKVLHRTGTRFRTALADAERTGVDHVFIAGDLTRDGTVPEFDRFDDAVGELETSWSAIPGNHDVRKAFDDHDGIGIEEFEARYADRGFPFVVRLGGVDVVCLNTAAPTDVDRSDTWAGAVGPAQRGRLRDLLAGRDRPVVALAHHNLGALPEHDDERWANFRARDAPAARDALAGGGVDLVVTAHQHVPAVADRGAFTEILSPAVCSYPQAWLAVRIDESGTTVRLRPLADRAGLEEARRLAATGRPLGRGVLELAENRLDTIGRRE